MPCISVKIGEDTGTICFPHQLKLKWKRKWYSFDWADRLGPTVTAIDHIPYEGIPPEEHPFWDGLDAWIAQGKRIGHNGECLFDGRIKIHSDGKLKL